MSDHNETRAAVRRHVEYKRDAGELNREVAARMLAALDSGAEPDYMALWRDATFLDPPSVVYHSAPRAARDSIAAGGLRAAPPSDGRWGSAAAGQPAAVYVSAKPDLIGAWVHDDEWDVWEIRRGDLAWGHDTLNPGCWWLESVPRDAIQLVPQTVASTASQSRMADTLADKPP